MSSPSSDAGIPVLTEVIDLEPEQTAPVAQAPAAPAGSTTPASPATVEELEARAVATMGSDDWNRLERALRERILRQLLARVDNTLEQRVRDSLADVLQGAVSTLALDIRSGLHQSLEDMIVRAVAQELTRLRISQN
ncbi:hypothetical protein [Lacisediminimonas sp.]|uniref:hypothetical protein n=1 Tax=Lacisediminimonas sp. TaxID=3060582 RepID=UPI002727D1F1|nr:hypothetical protein [Lacisediminimonas sp.]MDO8299072.1 hypothetical protein [Lacisediminimonas sp.]MDO9219057.1 hypothetical protein [Lacisediminimonas sp.]